jgi:hypothetical protein
VTEVTWEGPTNASGPQRHGRGLLRHPSGVAESGVYVDGLKHGLSNLKEQEDSWTPPAGGVRS